MPHLLVLHLFLLNAEESKHLTHENDTLGGWLEKSRTFQVTFEWKKGAPGIDDKLRQRRTIGFIAQEVEGVFPELVHRSAYERVVRFRHDRVPCVNMRTSSTVVAVFKGY